MYEGAPSVAAQRSSGSADSPGEIRYAFDASGNVGKQIRLFLPSGSTLAIGQIMKVAYSGYTSGNPQVATPASGSAAIDRIVVATAATVSGTWDWFWLEGNCNALVEGTTDVSIGDYLLVKASVSTTGLVKDGTALSVNSVAIAQAAQTANSAVLTLVYLLGEKATLTQ